PLFPYTTLFRSLRFPADAIAGRDNVGGFDHGQVQGRLVFEDPGIGAGVGVVARADVRHAFHAAGDHRGRAVHDDARRRAGDRLQARGAEAVDRGAAHADGQPGADHRLAADVAAGGAFGITAAQDGVFD